jgi:uncharacterized RmlC-like cupin family protein
MSPHRDRASLLSETSEYTGKQGPRYAAGVSAESVGSQMLWLGVVNIAPGARTDAHMHEDHETAIYVLEGEVDVCSGPALAEHFVSRAGDYVYIPAGVSHVAVNRSATMPARAMIARTDPNEQESVVLQPELERHIP